MPRPSKEHPDPRDEAVDTPLQVATWPTPLTDFETQEEIPPGAPSWWKGEEAASAEFMRSMNIHIGPDGKILPR